MNIAILPVLYKGDTIAPDPVAKYLFSNAATDTSSAASIVSAYNTTYTDISTIETYFGVGTAGIATVEGSYTRNGSYLRETFYADKTSSASFWADIIGWLYLNNFYGATYDSGLDKYLINDSQNHAYFHIK